MSSRAYSFHPLHILKVHLAYVFDDISKGLKRANIQWRDTSEFLSRSASFDIQMDAVSTGKRARVDYKRILKKYVKQHFNDFDFERDFGEVMTFARKFSENIELILEFDKINHLGLGKAFTVNLRIEVVSQSTGIRTFLTRNLFSVLGTLDKRYGTYTTSEELLNCLELLKPFLERTIPIVSNCSLARLSGSLDEMPQDAEIRGALSAKQELLYSQPYAKKWADDACLSIIDTGGELGLREQCGSRVTVSGVLTPHGDWYYQYLSPKRNQALWISIPFVGSITTTFFETPATFTFLPLNDNWMDSTELFSLAFTSAEVTGQTSIKMYEAGFRLEYDPARYGLDFPRCHISYRPALSADIENSFYMLLNGLNGEVFQGSN